jgi:hypothetical protein
MPLPLAVPFALACGMSLAWIARAELARSEVPLVLARPFLVALGLGFVVVAPVMGYFTALHGDWAYLYLVRWARIPSAVDLLFVLGVGAAVPAGFAVASPWAIAKRGPLLVRVVGVLVALLAIAAVVSARRLAVSATYAQYHGGFGVLPTSKTPLGRGLLLSWVALAAGYAWSAWVLRPRAREHGGAP